MSIADHYKLQMYRHVAAERNWPTVDFKALQQRVIGLTEVLKSVVLQDGMRGDGVMPTAFRKDLSIRHLTAKKLAARKFGPLDISRPG